MSLTIEVPASAVQQLLKDLNLKLPCIASAYKESVSEVEELEKEATEGLREIRKCDELQQVPEIKRSYQSLSKTTEAVHTYLDKVNGLYRLLKEQTPGVIEDLKQGKSESIEQLFVEIDRKIQDCKLKNATLLACFQDIAASCDRAEMECEKLAKEKEKVKKVSGTIVEGVKGTAKIAADAIPSGPGTLARLGLPLFNSALEASRIASNTEQLATSSGKAAESLSKLIRRSQKLRHNIEDIQNEIHGIDIQQALMAQ